MLVFVKEFSHIQARFNFSDFGRFFNQQDQKKALKMLMPKKHRTLVYEYLMKEGVVVAEKDFGLDKHPAIPVPNIHVIKALQVR